MTEIALQSMGNDPHLLSKRLGAFLRRKGSAKEIAALVRCDVRTAENLREGHWPIARHWLGVWLAFGDDVIEAVFHPERAAARLEREVRSLEAQLAQTKADLAAYTGSRAGLAEDDRSNPRRPAKDLDEELFVPRSEPAARTDAGSLPGMRRRT